MAASTQGAEGSGEELEQVDPTVGAALVRAIFENLKLVMHAPDEALLYSVLCLMAGGHILLEDMPGTGKTTLAKALAKSAGCTSSRIQFTPDLEARDVAGFRSYHDGKYDFHPGPLFNNIVVADEINRAAPRTQAVLLEAMQERQVTVGAVAHTIKDPFMVLATQNPIEQVGTFELPEAQMDRFMVRLSLGYPPQESEIDLILEQAGPDPLEAVGPVTKLAELRRAIADVRQVSADRAISAYVVALLQATRADRRITIGASPRAGIALMRLAKAYALAAGRHYVQPEDVRFITPAVLSHRIVLTGGVKDTPESVLLEILERTAATPRSGRGTPS